MTEAPLSSQGPAALPAEVTSFVGRRADRARVRELMTSARLVTLTGFGGIGKTRLALRVGGELKRLFSDGVYFVPLGGLTSPDGVPDHVANALGLRGRARQSATVAVVEYLRRRNVLLVLDNCEHVIDVAAVLADTLLRDCADVRLLATSRQPLRIDGEAVYPVSPLTVPAGASGPLQEYEAVQLFLDRAAAVEPSFVLAEDNRDAVAGICRKLEGIPLAIELATARLRTFSPRDLDKNLNDKWELLSRGNRTAPYRQSTMAACIDWSFELCSPSEKRLWAKAAVFVDGFELDAALAICADPDDDAPLVDTLESLVEKSIVSTSRHDGLNRFRMLPPIRHRGLTELQRMGRTMEISLRHRDFYVDLAVKGHRDWFTSRQLDWIRKLRRDDANLRSALELCASDPTATELGLQAAGKLAEVAVVEGRMKQGRRWLDRLLARDAGNAQTRMLAIRASCWWATNQGDVEAATLRLEESKVLADALGGEARYLYLQSAGLLAVFNGDPSSAAEMLDESVRMFTASGNRAEASLSAIGLALARVLLGDFEGALESHRTCMAFTEAAGEYWLRAWSLWIAGLGALLQGDVSTARERLSQGLRLKRMLSDSLGVGALLEALAWLTVDSDPERTVVLIAAAQNEWDKIETSISAVTALDARHDDVLDIARTRLGTAGYETAWARGRSLDRDAATALALDEHPVRSDPEASTPRPTGAQVLTRRELQIADLINKGLSNKDIADTLVISKRTAETHVEHILTKLGFTSRTQVATWVAELSQRGNAQT